MPILTQPVSVSEDWQVDGGDTKPPSLVVQLRKAAYVLPWFRFVYAQGDDSVIVIAFASHRVTVRGHGLAALLAAVSATRVVRIVQPTESEAKFNVRGPGSAAYTGSGVTSITVEAARVMPGRDQRKREGPSENGAWSLREHNPA